MLNNDEDILFLKQKEIFNKLVEERFNETSKLNGKTNFHNLRYSSKNRKMGTKRFLTLIMQRIFSERKGW